MDNLSVEPNNGFLGKVSHVILKVNIRVNNHLRYAIMVSQINKENAPMVSFIVNPSGHSYSLSYILIPQFPARMRSEFMHYL